MAATETELFNGDATKLLDSWAVQQPGVSSLQLMEQAGSRVAECVTELAPKGRTVIVCGKGNNAGDGYVAARLLTQSGYQVEVLTTADLDELSGDAAVNVERLSVGIHPFTVGRLNGATVIVDALLGTGFVGKPYGVVAEAITAINLCHDAAVVAVDVPSGVDANTGEVTAEAVNADITVSFHTNKVGLNISPGKQHAGEVRLVDIGIPNGGPVLPVAELLAPSILKEVPKRDVTTSKFTAGVVGVVGGSVGMSGAPCLAAMAAQRAGAGYVHLCVPEAVHQICELQLPEVVSTPLKDQDGSVLPQAAEQALKPLGRADAVVVGPGLGRASHTQEFVRELLVQLQKPVVLDADGLAAYNGRAEELKAHHGQLVLTPHVGELAKLLGVEAQAVTAQRLKHLKMAVELTGSTVVLKGDDTAIMAPTGELAISPGGCPALASAGTGDVLAGVIASLLAQGLQPHTAAKVGVMLHLLAGQRVAAELGNGLIASDVIEQLAPTLLLYA